MKSKMCCRLGVVVGVAVFLALPGLAGRLTERIAASCKVTGTDRFYGFERTTFEFQGHEAWVVEPSVAAPKKLDLDVSATGPSPRNVKMRRYLVDVDLLKLVREATTDSGETDTAKWMTGAR